MGLPPDNLPPSLYEFYLVMIYRQQILPTTLTEFTRTDHKGKQYTPLLENVTFREIHAKISKIWSGGLPSIQSSRLPWTSPRVSPIAPSLTRSRPLALVV